VTKLSRQHRLRVRFGSASWLQLGCGCCHTCISLGERLTEGLSVTKSRCELLLRIFLQTALRKFFNCKCPLLFFDTRKVYIENEEIPNTGEEDRCPICFSLSLLCDGVFLTVIDKLKPKPMFRYALACRCCATEPSWMVIDKLIEHIEQSQARAGSGLY